VRYVYDPPIYSYLKYADSLLPQRERTLLSMDSKILRLRIETLEEEVEQANKSLDLADQERRDLNQCYAAQSRQFDTEREAHARAIDTLQAELASAQEDLSRGDAEQEAALKLLEEVESELKGANGLVHSLHAKAESLEVKYEEELHVLEDLQRENTLLKAEIEAKEQARTVVASNTEELSSRLASAEANNLELSAEKKEMAASLEAALQRAKELEERLAASEQRSSKFLMRSTLVSWLARG
jgi:chromosome segregation ATPase